MCLHFHRNLLEEKARNVEEACGVSLRLRVEHRDIVMSLIVFKYKIQSET